MAKSIHFLAKVDIDIGSKVQDLHAPHFIQPLRIKGKCRNNEAISSPHLKNPPFGGFQLFVTPKLQNHYSL